MLKVIYNPKNMLRICEYAGRTCWQSHENQKTPSAQFIGNLVKIAHESIIEHGHIIIKANKKEYSAGTLLRALMNVEDNVNASNVNATLVEGETNWFIGLNIRGLKNILRNTEKENVLRKDIISTAVPVLPSPFFEDLFRDGIVEPYLNVKALEYPYPTISSRDTYSVLTDLNELERDMKKLLEDEPELTINMLTKLIPITMRWMAPMPINEQFLRHRSPVSKQSLRYTSGANLKYHTPKKFKDAKFKIARHLIDANCPQSSSEILEFSYHDWMSVAGIVYEQGIQLHNAKKEDCRFMLPMAVETEVVFTKTINQWIHVGLLRVDKHTQLHTRNIMSWIILMMTSGAYPILGQMFASVKDGIIYEDLYELNK